MWISGGHCGQLDGRAGGLSTTASATNGPPSTNCSPAVELRTTLAPSAATDGRPHRQQADDDGGHY
jgi:hypothetical protein